MENILITKKSWGAPDGSLYIYQVQPQDPTNTVLTKHPIYRSYSVFSEQELLVGDSLDVELKPKKGKNGVNYYVTKVYFKFPDTVSEQWEYLERIAENRSFKRLVSHLTSEGFLSRNSKPLDTIVGSVYLEIGDTGDDSKALVFSEDGKVLSEILSEDNPNISPQKYFKLYKEISGRQKNAQLVSLLGEASDCFTDSQIDKIVDAFSTPEEAYDKLIENPFVMTSVDGFGFKITDGFRAKLAEVYPDDVRYNIDSPTRITYGAHWVVDQEILSSGNTQISLPEFLKVGVQELSLPAQLLEEFLEKRRVDINNVREGDIIVIDNFVTTVRYFWAEKLIFDELTTKRWMPELLPNYTEELSEFLKLGEFSPSDEQMEVFESVNKSRFSMVVGPGGTGKTATVAQLIKFLKSKNLNVDLIAPTGKAAQTLSSYAEFPASTIHYHYKIRPESNNSFSKRKVVNLEKTGKGPDVVVVDEFSMVDSALLGDVLSVIKSNHSFYKNTRFLFVGDEYQLPSVGPGNLLHLFIEYNLLKTVRLTKSFRVKSGEGGIAQLSNEFRNGKFTLKNNDNKPFALSKDLIAQNIDSNEGIFAQTLNAYNTMLKHDVIPEDIMVLSPVNKGLVGQLSLNNAIQELIRKYYEKSETELYIEVKVYGEAVRFYQDDLVLFQNNRDMPTALDANSPLESFEEEELSEVHVNNGDVGKIVDITGIGVLVKNLVTKELVMVFREEMAEELRLGYAFTIHKSQGSESKYGIMVAARSNYYQLNANLLYTAVTRFKEKCYLFASFSAVRSKVKVFENKKRDTVLEYLIQRDLDKNAVF